MSRRDTDRHPMDRRAFWRTALRGLVAKPEAAPPPDVQDSSTAPTSETLVRPPGAVTEAAFLAACGQGCRLCADACPSYVIIPSLDPQQPGGGDGRPYLLPERAACDLCGACMPVCPTGALQVVAKADVRIGLAAIDFGTCVRPQGEACSICLEACPFPGAAIREIDDLPEIVDDRCTGCGLCAVGCPPSAIRVVPR